MHRTPRVRLPWTPPVKTAISSRRPSLLSDRRACTSPWSPTRTAGPVVREKVARSLPATFSSPGRRGPPRFRSHQAATKRIAHTRCTHSSYFGCMSRTDDIVFAFQILIQMPAPGLELGRRHEELAHVQSLFFAPPALEVCSAWAEHIRE